MALPFRRRHPSSADLDPPRPVTGVPNSRPSYLDHSEDMSSLAVSWRGLSLAVALFAALAVAAGLWL
jgi:hypothetical protein